MSRLKPVEVSTNAFRFCRLTVALIFWIALLTQSKELIILNFVIMALSALLKVRHAPLVLLWALTIDKIHPSKTEVVDENGMVFAHGLGATLALIALAILYAGFTIPGWTFVFFLCLLKTSSAFGYCGGLKLYMCMNSGSCCRVGKAVKKITHV
jgi:hypothetical protein